jgi:flavin reductase (DIM6/NTAB) family NADH-FMN oxidoreductase RutF
VENKINNMDIKDFRGVMGNFIAGVTVVTLPGDPPHGITVNSFTSVSLEPILISICLDHNSEAYKRLKEGMNDTFCINILAADQKWIGEYFANMGEVEENPFEESITKVLPTGSLYFENSIAYIDCSLYDDVEEGDHTVYMGKVKDAKLLQPEAEVLTYFRGKWGSV